MSYLLSIYLLYTLYCILYYTLYYTSSYTHTLQQLQIRNNSYFTEKHYILEHICQQNQGLKNLSLQKYILSER